MTKLVGARRSDQVDELADRLQDAVEAFRARRHELVCQLEEAKEAFFDVVIEAEDWAVKQRLLSEHYLAPDGEALLSYGRTEVVAEALPDLGTQFRERVSYLEEEQARETS